MAGAHGRTLALTLAPALALALALLTLALLTLKVEILEIEERKNHHINELMKKHEKVRRGPFSNFSNTS